MTKDFRGWLMFVATVILITFCLLLAMLYVVEVVEKSSSTWEGQIEQKETQEMDSIRLSEEN